ncbi:restriction endonuclease subunit S [Ligilactobacillus salivarius]|uniref:restriction endonuclease subunit S n=1 Tax=Ligilactobacillus salivarius TaxID=1624 RepID=UPI003F1F7406
MGELVDSISKKCDFKTDKIIFLNTGDIEDGKIVNNNCYKISDLPGQAKKKIKNGDILFSEIRPKNKRYALVENIDETNYVVSTKLMVLRNKDSKVLNMKYFYYFLTSPKMLRYLQSEAEARSGTFPQITFKDNIYPITINLPSLAEQNKIVKNIDSIVNKIKNNQKINTNLFELANIIFQQSFNCNGNIPLSHYFLPKRGKNLLKKNVEPGAVPVVAGGLKPAAYHNISNTETPVITISASGANAGYVQIWGQKVWSSDSSYIDSSITDNIYFWYIFLKSRQKQIFDAQTGSAQPHIYPKHIGNLLISELDEEQVQSFNKKVTPIFEKIFQNQKNNSVMEDVKNSLLYKFFNDY